MLLIGLILSRTSLKFFAFYAILTMGTFSPGWFWRSRVLWWRCSAGQRSLACTWRSSPQRRPPWSYSSPPVYQLQRGQGTRHWQSHPPHRDRGWSSVSPKLSSWTPPCTSYSTFWGWEVRFYERMEIILDNVAERRSVIVGFPPRVNRRWHFVDELLVLTSCLVIVFFFRFLNINFF